MSLFIELGRGVVVDSGKEPHSKSDRTKSDLSRSARRSKPSSGSRAGGEGAPRGSGRVGGGFKRSSYGAYDSKPREERSDKYNRRATGDDSRGSRPQVRGRRAAASPLKAASKPADYSLKLVATCALGLEFVVGRELEALSLGPIERDNAQVSFPFSPENLAKANYWLRSADRVWLQLAEFSCADFEELYQGVYAIEWPELLPRDAYFPVEAITTKSRLESVPAISSVAKKAAVQKMSAAYGRSAFPETGARFAIRVFIVYDRARVFIDTSGDGLHRRGYRTYNSQAPLRETVAAALVMLSGWSPEQELYDPMCGSGTIVLEAAGIGLKRAAGLERSFASQRWGFLGRKPWEVAHAEARDLQARRVSLRIYGSDIDGRVLKLARTHLRQSGLEDTAIQFQTRDIADFSSARKYGVVITNPPYGKRLGSQEEALELIGTFARVFEPLKETWSFYFFSALERFASAFGREPERVRKIYNGSIPCFYYQYPGPKPPGLGLSNESDGQEPNRKRIPLNP